MRIFLPYLTFFMLFAATAHGECVCVRPPAHSYEYALIDCAFYEEVCENHEEGTSTSPWEAVPYGHIPAGLLPNRWLGEDRWKILRRTYELPIIHKGK